jgi:hypothetical protein
MNCFIIRFAISNLWGYVFDWFWFSNFYIKLLLDGMHDLVVFYSIILHALLK